MTTYGPFTAFDLEFGTAGHLVDPASETDLLGWLASADGKSTTDLVVISHGWNNDMSEARQLYTKFFTAIDSVQQGQSAAKDRKFAVAAILWPSKRFADADLIAGGAAGLGNPLEDQLNAQLDQLTQIFAGDPAATAKIEHAREQIPKLEVSQSAQDDFVFALSGVMPAARGEKDEGLDDSISSLKSGQVPGHSVLERLSAPIFPAFAAPDASSGHALGVGALLGGVTAAATRLANLFTYYTMKDRAGIIGRTGVAQTVLRVQSQFPQLRIHLVGHSFGGRLVTSVANALTAPKTIASLLLLEAAYSHNGLGKNWDGKGSDGSFRNVLTLPSIAGPTLITHSVHDTAVGVAYPMASRIMNQVAAAMGDRTDVFGGMGRNGAQHTPEAFDDTLRGVGEKYSPAPAGMTVRNLNGDGPAPKPTINDHSDVAKPEIAWAWLSSL